MSHMPSSVMPPSLYSVTTDRLIGRTDPGTGEPTALTGTQATELLDTFTSVAKGLAPASGGGTANFLRADGTWVAPPGGGGGVSDGDKGDITVSVSGSTWTLDAGVVTLAKQANLATQRLIGRNTAGTGVPEAVTATQLFDWITTAQGSILTRGSSAWAAATNVKISGGDLALTDNSAPTTPVAGTVKAYSRDVAGRSMLATLESNGLHTVTQPHFGRTKIGWWDPVPNSTTAALAIGMASPFATGTATARGPVTTNLAMSLRRTGYVSAATAGSAAGARSPSGAFIWRGNAVNAGGFHIIFRFLISDAAFVATGRTFVGLHDFNAATDVDPETLTDCFGIGCDSGDTTMRLYASGAVAQVATDLGVNFPCNTTNVDVYELALFAIPNGSAISYQVTRLNTGDTTSGTVSAAASLFANTTFRGTQFWRSNGATATAVGIDMVSLYVETDI